MQRKKTLGTSLATLAVLVCVLLGNARIAQAHVPAATYNCNNNTCWGDQIWYGTTYGASVQFTVDKPNFLDTNAFYNKYLYLQGLVGSQRAFIGIARTKGNGFPSNSNYCGGSSSGIAWNYFIYTYDASGINADHRCYPVAASNENHLVTITAINFDCEGDGLRDDLDLQIQGYGSAGIGDCLEAEISGYSSIDDRMQWYGTVQDHMVWGGHWYNSAYITNQFQIRGQTRLPDTLNQHQPPQQYWNILPSTSLPGGDLWSCVYASGVTCTQGG